ncbi:hypothetical protein EXIGLDRAFT_137247 [Exidia glandulosa HHB12029]|uniref:Uncharacterized protein n=1 Tax=Exidia glandulosa HHB12029 TaxID=1314781 RepID=A0A165G078_EXIGL|nr:hypothetical protein EXIGLDRAFT_137247 [Exidia glandulosa HHB12029]
MVKHSWVLFWPNETAVVKFLGTGPLRDLDGSLSRGSPSLHTSGIAGKNGTHSLDWMTTSSSPRQHQCARSSQRRAQSSPIQCGNLGLPLRNGAYATRSPVTSIHPRSHSQWSPTRRRALASELDAYYSLGSQSYVGSFISTCAALSRRAIACPRKSAGAVCHESMPRLSSVKTIAIPRPLAVPTRRRSLMR